MFSKSKINEPGPKQTSDAAKPATTKAPAAAAAKPDAAPAEVPAKAPEFKPAAAVKPKAPASVLSTDLTVKGNLKTTGELQVEGTIEGDIRAHLLTVGETATIKGEVIADDVVVHGRVVGRVLGLKVRLSSTAKVEGDIADDPLSSSKKKPAAKAAATS